MTLRRLAITVSGMVALAVLTVPSLVSAQECVGDKPRGGMYATSAELYFDKARGATKPEDKQRNWQQAIGVLEDGFQKQPNNPRNYLMAGTAYAELGRYEDAAAAFNKAEEMWSCYEEEADEARYRAWTRAWNLGVRYGEAEEFDQAIYYYINAWLVYDKLPQPMLQLGSVYSNLALTSEVDAERHELEGKAIEAYSSALNVIPNATRLREDQASTYSRAAAFNLAQLLAIEERYEEAAAAYDLYLEQVPGDLIAMSNKAVVMLRGSSMATDQAEELEDGPEKEALVAKADSLQAAARAVYAELLEREDLEPNDYYNIGLGLARIGRYEGAAIAYKKILELEPYRNTALEALSRAYFAGGMYDSLLVVALQLVERYPMSLDNLALLANAHRELEQLEDGLAILERREALAYELTDLDVDYGEEGVYTLSGYIHNMKLDADTEVTLQFDFYDDAGEVVASETNTLVAPAMDAQAEFSLSFESAALISGFVYRVTDTAQAEAGG